MVTTVKMTEEKKDSSPLIEWALQRAFVAFGTKKPAWQKFKQSFESDEESM